ncbi:globin domain-containing protein [Streptomyces sp. NPDC047821]|uniref:globin domain-containing protein n=1 Tax=Streptomyces sp. NPDC047821 TaxID=3365488 RepID=UPI003723A04B
MDAPTTTSADNGTSGGSGGGSGWFTPRKPVTDRSTEPGAAHSDGRQAPAAGADEARDGSQEPIAGPRRPLTSIRMVGNGATRTAPPQAVPEHPADRARIPGAHGTPYGRPYNAPGRQEDGVDRPSDVPDHPAHPHPAEGGTGAPQGHTAPAEQHPAQPHSADHQGWPTDRADSAPDQPAPAATPGPPSAPATNPDPDPAPAGAEDPASAAEPGSPDAVRVRRTLAEIAPVADKVTSYFYALLFTRSPELRALFPAAMETQRDRLLKALLTAAEHMDNAGVLTEYLQHLGRGHRKYGTEASHYPAVGEALIGALSRYATTTWDQETEAAWVRTYTTISQIMIDAAAENERHAPAWWHAEVVSHDLRTPDIAVITVRPDQPYPFLAGQYTSLETPWWPRIWRHYSFASAPRSDGLLSFHVKAVPAGWVSNALVHHARPGDVLRLGPPAGSMTVDHTTDNGLLCLGGGTGIAPIKALVEDVAEHGERRPVEVFYGARTDHDLYDIDTMLRLQQSHPWLEVRAIIDGKTQLPDVVREYGPWNEYDAYLSGPVGMIRSSVDALRGVGVPYERIRHDSLEELVAAAD